jgi:hypothetical protein
MTETQLRGDLAGWDNNTYGAVRDVTSLDELSNGFGRLGWSVRRTGWEEHEAECSWCRVTFFDTGGSYSLSGVVDPTRDRDLALILTSLGVGYEIELYDTARNLLRTLDPDST